MKHSLAVLLTMPLALTLLLACSPVASAADEAALATCQKRPFKQVKTITPFALVHRPNSKKILYDDIVCGLKWRRKQCSSIQGSFDNGALVHDFNTKAAITIKAATFVISPAITSPTGSGVAAFSSPAAAETFVAQNPGSKKLTYEELLRMEWP